MRNDLKRMLAMEAKLRKQQKKKRDIQNKADVMKSGLSDLVLGTVKPRIYIVEKFNFKTGQWEVVNENASFETAVKYRHKTDHRIFARTLL